MLEEWVRSIHSQCTDQCVPFFFKQWGGVQKSKAGRLLNGRTYDEMPKRIVGPMPARKGRMALVQKWAPRTTHWQGDLVMPTAVA